MKANNTIRTLIIFSLIFISSCKGEKENHEEPATPRIKKFSQVTKPEPNQSLTIGEPISFEIKSKETVDSVKVEFEDNIEIFTSTAFQWKLNKPKTGKQKIRLTVYSGENDETHYARVVFLSDLTPATSTYQVIAEFNHNEEAFIQGLFFIGDTLVESTGQEGTSWLSKYNYQTGEVYKTINLSSEHFGEGSTYWGDKIFYLTWKSNKGFIYNRDLIQTGQFNYTHEGWGMTTMGDTLVVSDGKETLHLLDPRDLTEIGTLQVYDDKGAVTNLNELEYFQGQIFANIWQEDIIISIDPQSGKVLYEIDLENLRDSFESNEAEVLNGIAYKANSDQIFVTGKLWPKLFEVKFSPIN
ncbi:MAG: glutaminyl-peptide cyclotransferase [Marinoscillum sp.]